MCSRASPIDSHYHDIPPIRSGFRRADLDEGIANAVGLKHSKARQDDGVAVSEHPRHCDLVHVHVRLVVEGFGPVVLQVVLVVDIIVY